jgi:hypothetical protein
MFLLSICLCDVQIQTLQVFVFLPPETLSRTLVTSPAAVVLFVLRQLT